MAMEGYIFGCGDDTIGECFARGLFGLPYKYRNQVEAILPGTPLYLFHFQQRVRFTVNDQQQAPISESQFEGVLGSNYYDCKRFTFRLNREQVDQLDTILSWQSGHYQGSEDFTGNEMVGGGFSGKLQIERAGNVVDAHPSLDSGLQSLQKASSRVVAAHKLSLLNLKALFSPSQSTFPINREELELGGDQRTTIYLGPFPGGSSYSASRILDLLNKNNRGKYNFMFVEHGHNDYRHCFLNMERPEYILSLMDELHSRDWHSLLGRSRREAFIIKVSFWKQQGLETLAKLFHGEGYWHSGGASTCKELYDNRALFFYGAGAKFACRNVPVHCSRDFGLREAGVTPISAFLHGWPDFGSANDDTRDYKPLEAAESLYLND